MVGIEPEMVARSKFVVRREARTDINKIGVYIGDRNLDAGLRFFDAAKAATEQVRLQPGIGARRYFRNKKLNNVRSWPITGFENYLMFYRSSEDGKVEILRVLHGSQDVDRIIGRM